MGLVIDLLGTSLGDPSDLPIGMVATGELCSPLVEDGDHARVAGHPHPAGGGVEGFSKEYSSGYIT